MAHAHIEPGATIDGFLIGEMVARGGMATLWQVSRPDIDLPLLMKVPILAEGEDPAAIVSFEMEQMILPRIAGAHVPKFIAAGDFDVQPYIVMERVPGPSLLPRLKDLPLGDDEAVAIAAKVAEALDDLHRQNVVHLDIKPSNILFRESGEAVLIDYGLARHLQLPDLMDEEFRLPYGTGPYMAPEQVLGVRSNPRSDIFALGVLIYFFTTGTRPFGDPQRLKGLKRRIWRDPVPPRKLRPDYPPWLQEIVLRCLEVDPARRYPSAAQLAFDLRHPDQVQLTPRAQKLEEDSFLTALKRRFDEETIPRLRARPTPAELGGAPIIVVALDLGAPSAALAETIRISVRHVLAAMPNARVACLNVLKQNRVALDETLDHEGNNKHVARLAALKHWAEPLHLAEGKVTFHVLDAFDAADAIIDYARTNYVDHIVMGARANSTMRTLLGSVSGEVAAQAPCSVTVVRTRRGAAAQTDVADA